MAVTLKCCTAYAFLIVVCAQRAALVEVPDPAGQVSTAFAVLLQIKAHLIYHIFFVHVVLCHQGSCAFWQAHTFLEIIQCRWGTSGHLVFGFIAFMTNFIVTIMMVMGAVVVTNVLTGVNSYGMHHDMHALILSILQAGAVAMS